jgi:hypothetical protein
MDPCDSSIEGLQFDRGIEDKSRALGGGGVVEDRSGIISKYHSLPTGLPCYCSCRINPPLRLKSILVPFRIRPSQTPSTRPRQTARYPNGELMHPVCCRRQNLRVGRSAAPAAKLQPYWYCQVELSRTEMSCPPMRRQRMFQTQNR